MKTIEFFDTTLRDGEQAPGNTMSPRNKLLIAQKLQGVGVNTIEAGFPASSKEDFEAVKLISSKLKGVTIGVFARCTKEDIDIAHESTEKAHDRIILLSYAVSDLHIKKKYKTNKKEAVKKIRDSINYAKKYFKKVNFGMEDATRADKKFLSEVIDTLLDEKVDSIGIGDTVGYSTPFEIFELTRSIICQVNNNAKISIHCHNDLGMATANTLAAILAGADEVSTTVNGIGERAGNASFEEIVVALHTRKDLFKRKLNISLKKLVPLSNLVYKIIRRMPSFEKPVVGINVFRHESGIHIDGLKKDFSTYEILNPKLIGRKREFLYGRHSGVKKKK